MDGLLHETIRDRRSRSLGDRDDVLSLLSQAATRTARRRRTPSCAWVPFGGGVRRCIGAAFAELEMRVVLRAMGQRVRLRPAVDDHERARRRAITMVPERDGLVRVA